jgi:hypothetical protein
MSPTVLWFAAIIVLSVFAIVAAGIASLGDSKPSNDDPED